TGVDINSWITASKGDVSIQADGTGPGDLMQHANVTASKGSVKLSGYNLVQDKNVVTTAGDGILMGASDSLQAARLNATGDVQLGTEGGIWVVGAVNGSSVGMQGTGVDLKGAVTASKGDVSIKADAAGSGNFNQSANMTASKGSVYITGSNVVQDYGVSTVAGGDVTMGTSGTLQTGNLTGKTVSLEGDTVYVLGNVNSDGNVVFHATNSACAPGADCQSDQQKGIFQLGNVTSRNGGVLMAVDPGVSYDPDTGIPTIAYTGMIGQYPTSLTRAATDISLQAVAVYSGNNVANKSIDVQAYVTKYMGTFSAPQITLPPPVTVSDNGGSSGR
uniref:hypothetical protein n=1 Tax=Paraburkholderia sp. J63 TaxID=2805434 RepID=UPI002ABDDB47